MKTYSRKKPSVKYEFDNLQMDLKEVCRLCLTEDGEKYPIFQDVGLDEVPMALRIMTCLSLQVFDGDGLPSQICQQCAEEVNRYYSFKKKCDSSDTQLRQYLKSAGLLQDHTQLTESMDATQADPTTLLCHPREVEEDMINDITDDLENKQLEVVAVTFNETQQNEAVILPDQPSPPKVPDAKSVSRITVKLVNIKPDHSITETKNLQGPLQEQQGEMNSEAETFTEMTPVSIVNHPLPIQGSLPFICSKCPKQFGKRIELRRHESVHDQQRGFECPVCEKWFPNKTSFGRHERTHTGERPFSCGQCGKCFSQGAILARHIMTHTGVKPYKCEVCNKGFTQREGLRVHMRQHSKDQPEIQLHECPLCEKSFCHPSGLSRHLIIHTGKTFDCKFCCKVFTDSSSLRRHMRRHGENSEQSLNPTQ